MASFIILEKGFSSNGRELSEDKEVSFFAYCTNQNR